MRRIRSAIRRHIVSNGNGQDGQVGQVGQVGNSAEASGLPAEGPSAKAGAELKAIVEALIFASPEPLTLKAMCKLLDSEPKEDVRSEEHTSELQSHSFISYA